MGLTIDKDTEAKITDLISKYPDKEAALLPLLHILQAKEGYINKDATEYAASLLEIPFGKVRGVATFYSLYNKEKVGRHLIQVCANISCSLLKAQEIVSHIEKRLGIKVGKTTEDEKFTLLTVECLGSCGTAPMMQINKDYYENLTIERVDEILGSLE